MSDDSPLFEKEDVVRVRQCINHPAVLWWCKIKFSTFAAVLGGIIRFLKNNISNHRCQSHPFNATFHQLFSLK